VEFGTKEGEDNIVTNEAQATSKRVFGTFIKTIDGKEWAIGKVRLPWLPQCPKCDGKNCPACNIVWAGVKEIENE